VLWCSGVKSPPQRKHRLGQGIEEAWQVGEKNINARRPATTAVESAPGTDASWSHLAQAQAQQRRPDEHSNRTEWCMASDCAL
jgi:hypothetical protein